MSSSLNKVFNLASAVTSAAVLSVQPGSFQNEQGNEVLVDVVPATEMVQVPQYNVSSRMPTFRAISKATQIVVAEADVAPTSKSVMSKRNPSEVRVCKNGHECCADIKAEDAVVRSLSSKLPSTSSSRNSKVILLEPTVQPKSEASPAQSTSPDVTPLSRRVKSDATAVQVEVDNQTAPPASEMKVKSQRASRIAEIPVDTAVVSAKPASQAGEVPVEGSVVSTKPASQVAEVPAEGSVVSTKPASQVAEVPVEESVVSTKPASQAHVAEVPVEGSVASAKPTSQAHVAEVSVEGSVASAKPASQAHVAEVPVEGSVVSAKPTSRIAEVAVSSAVVSGKSGVQSRRSRVPTTVVSRRSVPVLSKRLASKLPSVVKPKVVFEGVSEGTATTSSRPDKTTIVVENKKPSKVRSNISRLSRNVQVNTTPYSLECILNDKPLHGHQKKATIRITDKSIGRPNRQRLVVSTSSPVAMSSRQPRNRIVMTSPDSSVAVVIS